MPPRLPYNTANTLQRPKQPKFSVTDSKEMISATV